MKPPARATGALGLAELAGVAEVGAWSRCRSGECVACWEAQRTATLTGQRVSRRRPARWSGHYQGRAVGLCAHHHGELTSRSPGGTR
ncbi:MAG: hypothetical protein ACRDTG_14130 [Pseudonocardiaceae bacterium]